MSIPVCDSYLCVGNTIGSGAYGRVSIVTGSNVREEKNYALKECIQDNYQHGIFGIMEPIILMSLRHPYLVRGIEAKVDSMSGYYVQELGKRSLFQQRRNEEPTPQQKKRYCHQLAQAVKMLHALNIVHGDIKSSNVIMHTNDSVTLIDFSLSFITRANEEYFSETCTANYRPPEIILKKGWNKSIDIWCLACVFYEIYYGRYLFKGQSGDIERNEALARTQMTNVMADWNDVLVEKFRRQSYSFSRQQVDYIPLTLDPTFDFEENKDFNNLIVNMMEIKADERYDIDMVLNHPYFRGEERVNGNILRSKTHDLDPSEENRLQRHLELLHLTPFFQEKVRELYRRCNFVEHTLEQEMTRVKACLLIVDKMYHIPSAVYDDTVYRMERELANALHFRLFP